MAIIQSPWLGRARNKLGGAVTYTSDGRVIARSMPASVKNPRTFNQVLTRVLMATVSKAYAKTQSITDHSFEGLAEGGKNQQRFIKLNVNGLRSAWRSAFNAGRDSGNFNGKADISAFINLYQISEGTLPTVVATTTFPENGRASMTLPAAQIVDTEQAGTTYKEVCDMLGLPAGSQLTFGFIMGNTEDDGVISRMKVARLILSPSDGDMSKRFLSDEAIQDPNEKNQMDDISLTAKENGLEPFYNGVNYDVEKPIGFFVIASIYENGKWRRSTQQILMNPALANKSLMQTALSSWMEGTEITSPLYLNQARRTNVEGL